MKRLPYIAILVLLLFGSLSGIALLVSAAEPALTAGAGGTGGGDGARLGDEDGPVDEAPAWSGAAASGRDEAVEAAAAAAGPGERLNLPPRDPRRLYLILDDGGHTLDDLRAFSAFDGVFTVAVLPKLPYSRETARMTVALGHDLIVHQPMEAIGGSDPGPGAVFTAFEDHRIRRIVRTNLRDFPDAIGINNHMGSKATSNARVMSAVVEVVANRALFFLDSRTTHTSVGAATAENAGLPPLKRDVFLDNVRSEEAISKQLDLALEIAATQDFAVMIGHVTSPELARVLIDRYDAIVAAGYTFHPLSDLAAGEALRIAHEDTGN
ncbi:MAG: divergent polysaccharide deacetylase family protein [Spirochaeta sp.]|jgi:polysaccharide deacetylase 2 family uncharacterized protein YibQ|nr:divergent polysaccharide deacetylase family protein [Spirochaeta sp.]